MGQLPWFCHQIALESWQKPSSGLLPDWQNETAGHSESQNSMILFLVWRKEQTTFLCQGIVKNNTEENSEGQVESSSGVSSPQQTLMKDEPQAQSRQNTSRGVLPRMSFQSEKRNEEGGLVLLTARERRLGGDQEENRRERNIEKAKT